MKPELRHLGESLSPLVIIDDFSGSAEQIACIADALAPYPPVQGNYYPGVRRIITTADGAANDYVIRTCERAAPFIGGAFNVDRFDLTEASFSIVTLRPDQLEPRQRAPHFDSPDQNVFAMLHFLRVPQGSGTAFYRHRTTKVERVTEQNVNRFVFASRADYARLASDSGYMKASDDYYEQIGMVEAVPDRMIMYPGSLLHSGIIPPDMEFSDDPRVGRLTANFFIYGHQGARPNG